MVPLIVVSPAVLNTTVLDTALNPGRFQLPPTWMISVPLAARMPAPVRSPATVRLKLLVCQVPPVRVRAALMLAASACL